MNYVKINTEIQKILFQEAIKKAGSERKLKQTLNFPLIMIYYYKKAIYNLPEERFDKLINYLDLDKEKINFQIIDSIVYKKLGGKKAFQKSKKNKTFEDLHKKMRKESSKRMKKWHKEMKNKHPYKYALIQYERFKKIGNYKTETNDGKLVRNWLEKEVSDFLSKNKINYKYEPCLKCKQKYFFPDFVFNKTILECTAWKGNMKAKQLAKKITAFKEIGFEVFVVIPKALASFYKPIEKNIIYLEELGDYKKFVTPKLKREYQKTRCLGSSDKDKSGN